MSVLGGKRTLLRVNHHAKCKAMEDYVWSHPERRDLYLAARILARGEEDGDWRQWASDTLIQDLELYDDPRQGVGAWLAPDEVELANELGESLWRIVGADPDSAASLLAGANSSMRAVASKIVERIEANGPTLGRCTQRVESRHCG
jgi:hypothetical protein